MNGWPRPHSPDSSLRLWIETSLDTDERPTPQPPVQGLSRKEGKDIVYENSLKNKNKLIIKRKKRKSSLWYIWDKRLDWVVSFHAPTRKERRRARHTASSSAPWPRFTFTCYVPYSSRPLAHRSGDVHHYLELPQQPQAGWRYPPSSDEETDSGVRWLVQGSASESIAEEGLEPGPSNSQPGEVGIKQCS